MSRAALHMYRLIVPGVLVLLLLLSLLVPHLSLARALQEAVLLKDAAVLVLVVAAVGALYEILDIRKLFLGDFWHEVNENIKSRLIAALPPGTVPDELTRRKLSSGRSLKDVFYALIDNDKSLSSRATGVYFNGLLVTSSTDLTIIAALGVACHMAMVAGDGPEHAIWALITFLLFLVGQKVLIPATIRKHKELSNEQLDFISTHCRDRLTTLVEEALAQVRG